MTGFARPVVVASKCLEVDACRYNGQLIRAPLIRKLTSFVELKPVCPEVEIGLGVPRDPIRIVQLHDRHRLVQPSTERDITDAMTTFSATYLDGIGAVDGFILKSRSPSCGIKDTKVYGPSEESGPIAKSAGLFGQAVLDRFPHAAVEDEGRLTNFRLRHHFLTKLFTLAAFRAVHRQEAMRALIAFHAANKLLLMAYHQTALKRLGRIVANAERRTLADVAAAYEEWLGHALQRPARSNAHINVLTHAMGYFKETLTRGEKAHFLETLDEYRAGRVELSAPLTVVQSWIARHEQDYLAQQTYFAPYPRDLLDLRDSGRGL